MSVKDVRRWRCDSCTQVTEAEISSAMRSVPIGWVEIRLSNQSHANHTRWWCPSCVEVITRNLPNALGEFATNWPHHARLAAHPTDRYGAG